MGRLTQRDEERGFVYSGHDLTDIVNKLAIYENIEDELERLYGGRMSIGKLVNEFNDCIRDPDGTLSYARILTNAEAEKWDKLKAIEDAGMVYEVFYFKPFEEWNVCNRLPLVEDLEELGKTVFLTKAEAEAKLAELKGVGDE